MAAKGSLLFSKLDTFTVFCAILRLNFGMRLQTLNCVNLVSEQTPLANLNISENSINTCLTYLLDYDNVININEVLAI